MNLTYALYGVIFTGYTPILCLTSWNYFYLLINCKKKRRISFKDIFSLKKKQTSRLLHIAFFFRHCQVAKLGSLFPIINTISWEKIRSYFVEQRMCSKQIQTHTNRRHLLFYYLLGGLPEISTGHLVETSNKEVTWAGGFYFHTGASESSLRWTYSFHSFICSDCLVRVV